MLKVFPLGLFKLREGEKPLDFGKRFNVIDNNTIKFITADGIEKKIDIEDDFRETGFNVIPNFDPSVLKSGYYDLVEHLEPNNTLRRLLRKY